jgi:hypothetical protein
MCRYEGDNTNDTMHGDSEDSEDRRPLGGPLGTHRPDRWRAGDNRCSEHHHGM